MLRGQQNRKPLQLIFQLSAAPMAFVSPLLEKLMQETAIPNPITLFPTRIFQKEIISTELFQSI